MTQKSPSAHHRATISRALSSQIRHVSTIGKKLVKQQYLLHMSSQYGELRPTSGWDRFGFWGTQRISTGFASWFRYCSDVAHRRQPNFARCLAVSWARYIHCRGFLPRDEFCLVQNSLYVPSLAFSYTGSVTARLSSSGRQLNFAAWYKEWNYRTFAERASHIRLGGHHVGHRPTF